MRRIMVYLLFLGFCIFQSFGEQSEIGNTEFYWDQTGCADPWASMEGNSEEELKLAILDYLKSEGVKKARIIGFSDEAEQQFCLACICTTGRRFHLEVPSN
ncbi:hypothetical protein AAGF08_07700 [Algoriphagus sp. SE2]|uniref:hypothetical protein n=1 Tax=Algoriphagus sp. SE2 TaxID=3141536 RepID=UPI0031CD9998